MALVTVTEWLGSLAQELLHAMGMAKKKKKKKKKEEIQELWVG